ncbi:MAG: PAS domain S-box protein [Actinomycetota bacterium]|nr:PAS domain S-box protein [Actinomycetota bacterium]
MENTKADPWFSSHPATVAHPNIGCYISVPVVMSDGALFGTLCAVDPEPRQLAQQQADLLAVLARVVATAIERDNEINQRKLAEQQLRHQLEYTAAITSSLASGLYAVDQEGCLTFVNPAAQRALGRTEAELLGKDMHQLIHHHRADGTPFPKDECPLLGVIDSGETVRIDDDVFTRKDGTTFSVAYTSQPIIEDGQIRGTVVSFRDLTKDKRAEETQARLAAIVQSSDDAIIGKTLDGIITSWNRGAERLYGYSADEVVGQHVSILVPPDYPDDVPNLLQKLRRGEHISRYETKLFSKSGRVLEVSLTLSPIKDSRDNVVGASTIARDITERKQVEKERAQALATQRAANEDLERINKVRKDFVSIVSHEFRTALTGIQGFSQMMHDEDFGVEEMKEMASDIYEDATRLSRMINEMLDLDRMESGRMTLNLDGVDLNEILARTTDQVRSNAPNHHVRLQLDEGIPELLADRDKLTQVVTNLLTNAVKYSPDGGKITVYSQLEDDFAHVRVTDEGVGIQPEILEKLFEPYTRAESGTTRYIQGTGLGLAISRQIITLHGGHIWVESELGAGSTFHFTVPLDASRPVADS